jgi:tetratricopeptide (TPR) repeat protein
MSGRGYGSAGEEAQAVRIRLLGGFRISVGTRVVEEGAWQLRKAAANNLRVALCPEGHLWVDVELYAGELLPEDRYEEWAEEKREELRATYLNLLEELAALYEERGEFGPAVETLRRAVTEEPTNEEAHVGLMRLYAVSDRRREALAQYERLREVLSGQLGSEPNAATQRLRDEIAADGPPAARTLPTSIAMLGVVGSIIRRYPRLIIRFLSFGSTPREVHRREEGARQRKNAVRRTILESGLRWT